MKVSKMVKGLAGVAMMVLSGGNAQAESWRSVNCRLYEEGPERRALANFVVSSRPLEAAAGELEYRIDFSRSPWIPSKRVDLPIAFRVVEIDESFRDYAPQAIAQTFETNKGISIYALHMRTATKRSDPTRYYGDIGIAARVVDPTQPFEWDFRYTWSCGRQNPFLN